MKILYTNFHLAEDGGHTTYILNLLKNAEHEKYVACPPGSRLYNTLESQAYDKLIPLKFPSTFKHVKSILANALALKRIIDKYGIDIVHTNGSADNRMTLYASLLCPRKKFKVVFTKHNTQKITGFISKLRLNRFNDAVIFVSESVIRLAGIQRHNPRYHVVEHGIDLEYWQKREPIRTGHPLRLVSNAGTQRHKGWIHLLEAIQGLPEETRKRLSVVVLGRLRPYLDEVRADCEIAFPGFLEDPRPFLEQADIGFVLSYKEASSFACREMLAMGLPVISSDFPNHVKNIDTDCGWVTRTGDSDSIREVLLAILAMPAEQIDAMKRSARQKAASSFSLEKMLAATNAVYAAVMEPVERHG